MDAVKEPLKQWIKKRRREEDPIDTSSKDGIFAGNGVVTYSNQSPTLFITNFPSYALKEIEELFSKEEGFMFFRGLQTYAFVDFDSNKASTLSMRKYQGKLFGNEKFPKKLKIDFDKDPRKIRNLAYEKNLNSKDKTKYSNDYFCLICNFPCLRLEGGKTIAECKKRRTDNSFLLPEVIIKENHLIDGEVKDITREKGIERQWRLNCKGCNVFVAYRCTAPSVASSSIYIVDNSLTLLNAAKKEEKK